MPSHEEKQHFDFSTRQLYDLVFDVKRYPEFLPWCRDARILESGVNEFTAELIICFKHITEKYTSKVVGLPPKDGQSFGRIDVELVKGPFEHLENHWIFSPKPDGGCEVHFSLDFAFKSKLLDKLIGGLFTRASEKMVGAFSDRANSLYVHQLDYTHKV